MRPGILVSCVLLLEAGCASQNESSLGNAPNLPSEMASANRQSSRCPWPDTRGYAHAPKRYTPDTGGAPANFSNDGCAVMSFRIDTQGKPVDVRILRGNNDAVSKYASATVLSMRFDQPAKPDAAMLFKVGVARKSLRGDQHIVWAAEDYW